MKAIRIHAYGGPDVLSYEDVPRPEPGREEVLVQVVAAGVNPVDWKTRAGGGQAKRIQDPFPLTLGWDLSGVVTSVGEGVASFSPGDEVFGLVRFPQPGATYAEYCVAPASDLAPKPAALTHVEAAGVPLAGLTAWQALIETARLEPEQRVLVHAAAGGVGHLAVQLARWKGAHVIGTASERNARFLRSLGVEEVVDYRRTRFEEIAHDVDVVLDTIGNDVYERSLRVIRSGGVLVSVRKKPPQESERGARCEYVLVQPDGAQLAQLAGLIDAGHVRPVVERVLPLADVAEAHALSEEGHARGKIVLQISE